MEIRIDGAEIKVFIKLVKDRESFVGKATLSIRGRYVLAGEEIGGAMEIGGFRVWSSKNKRTGGDYLVTPPSYRAGSLGYKPYFFAFAFSETEDKEEKKRLWYKLEDLIVQAVEDKLLAESQKENEEEINLDEISL